MKIIMLLILTIPFLSCTKPPIEVATIDGSWMLETVELFENDSLIGSLNTAETMYQFRGSDESGELIVSTDDETEIFAYDYSPSSQRLTLDQSKIFYVQELSLDSMIMTSEYAPFKSVYRFAKV